MKAQVDSMLTCIKKNRKTRYGSVDNSSHPSGIDIYNKFRKEKNVNQEEILKNKETIDADKIKAIREKYLLDEMCGNYLDIPESELEG
jgi:hypothetical protein